MKIKIKGTIIPDSYAETYEWFGLDYTSPSSIQLPEGGSEDVDVEINSYGGDVYSGSEIYTALKSYPGRVTTIVTGIAASMASVIAMAGDVVKMAPTSQMMIHNVSTMTEGDKRIMSHEAEVLNGFDKTIANAYRIKTGLDQEELLELMDKETWLTPQEAVTKGFADEILFVDEKIPLLVAAAPQAVFLSKDKIAAFRQQKGVNMGEQKTKDLEGKVNDGNVEETLSSNEATKEQAEINNEETEIKPDNADQTVINSITADSMMVNGIMQPGQCITVSAKAMPVFENEATGTLETINGGVETMEKNYREVFLNYIRGMKLDATDKIILQENNKGFSDAFTHDTTNTAIVIPQTTQDKIWARASEGHAFLKDVKRLSVKGELRMIRHKSIDEGDATWYVEATPTADEKNTFDDLVLKGHELSKAVSISWKLRAMAMDDFENFLINELGERISVALGLGVINGTGTDQATGVVTVIKKAAQQQAKVATTGKLTYTDILGAIAKVHSSYKAGAAFYANSTTIWTKIANVLDNQGRPLFVPDRSIGGVGNVLGFPVKEDAALSDDEILIGNAVMGYVLNVNEPMSITTEDHAKQRVTDYVGYMVADGNVMDEKAFCLLSMTQGA